MTAGSQDGASFVNGSVQLRTHAISLTRDSNAGMRTELFQISRNRNRNIIIPTLPQSCTLLLANANHSVDLSLDTNLFIQGIGAGKQIVHYVSYNHGHVGTVVEIIVVKHAAGGQV